MFSPVVASPPLYTHTVCPAEAGMTSPLPSLRSRWESGGSMSVWSASPWWPFTCTSLPRSCHLPCRSGTAPASCSASGTGTSSTEVGAVRLWAVSPTTWWSAGSYVSFCFGEVLTFKSNHRSAALLKYNGSAPSSFWLASITHGFVFVPECC